MQSTGIISAALALAPLPVPGIVRGAGRAGKALAPARTHVQFQQDLHDHARWLGWLPWLADFRAMMEETARACVTSGGQWVIPSPAYPQYLFARDSFWVAAALNDAALSGMIVRRLREDQAANPDGHIATALLADGSRPANRDRDEESTMMYVLHSFLHARLGGTVSPVSLARARDFILAHVRDGRYVTSGETRTGAAFGGSSQVGTYHYWADTFRPAGRPAATPEVISYNQGLLCVALRCLEELGVALDPAIRVQAESVYANTVNPQDGFALPQREGSTIMDVSALVGEALSLYFWDASLLGPERTRATLNRFAWVYYPDTLFLGFKIISDFYGPYRPAAEFSGAPIDTPGHYHNGASWLLYDALALYAAARHAVPYAVVYFWQRLLSETRRSWASHEYLSTNSFDLGASDPVRDGYGWNTFVANLLPSL